MASYDEASDICQALGTRHVIDTHFGPLFVEYNGIL